MQTQATQQSASIPRVRSPGIDFDGEVPRHWFRGNVVATHIANGANLLFPAGERFFVRSVNRYLSAIDDPHLRARIKGFFGQEGRHAREHERAFETLEAQGFEVRRFLRLYEAIAYRVLEPVAPPELRLATTAALEHFTAIMAENALRQRMLDEAHPSMRALLLWHAAEEIEHRSVAFDVLQRVNPSHRLRMAGLGVATVCLAGFWLMGTLSLLAQEPDLTLQRLVDDARFTRQRPVEREVFARGIREYMRPDFHPSQSDVDHLADQYLAAAGLA